MGNNQELWPQDRKGLVRAKTSGVSSPLEWRDQGQPLLPHRQSSQFNTLHEEVSWLGCFFKQDLKPVQKPFQAWSWRLATDTPTTIASSERGVRGIQPQRCYRCFENLRVLTLPWLLNMRRGSNLYLGREKEKNNVTLTTISHWVLHSEY